VTLETIRYMGRTWFVCPVRGCTCIMPENTLDFLAAHPGAPTHYCADFDCWGQAWIFNGRVERVRSEPPDACAVARRALATKEGDGK
jgi:hypothetical protein